MTYKWKFTPNAVEKKNLRCELEYSLNYQETDGLKKPDNYNSLMGIGILPIFTPWWTKDGLGIGSGQPTILGKI